MQKQLLTVFQRLLEAYGARHWWPADSDFEVIVGAVLTQNTSWKNVEKAIATLKTRTELTASALLRMPEGELAEAIRPSGYYNIKAKRLRNICAWVVLQGGLGRTDTRSLNELRQSLLAVNGIGPETADDILLYALRRPVFVIDSYTRRIFSRLGWVAGDWEYERLRGWFERHLNGALSEFNTVQLFNEYHALIVNHATQVCNKKPLCTQCCLLAVCFHGSSEMEA